MKTITDNSVYKSNILGKLFEMWVSAALFLMTLVIVFLTIIVAVRAPIFFAFTGLLIYKFGPQMRNTAKKLAYGLYNLL